MPVVPYKSKLNKKEQIELMFDNISSKYDFLNHILSLGIDKIWRKKAVDMLKEVKPKKILDLATGTGDLAIQAYRTLNPTQVVGVDLSARMLEEGKRKMKKLNLENYIFLEKGDAEQLSFEDNSFDAVMVAFGVRNFENLEIGLKEINRVLKHGGKLVILEFSKPTKGLFRDLYVLYFNKILPNVAKCFSKDRSAYEYLPNSVESFPHGEAFLRKLKKVGFNTTACKSLTLGISSIYTAIK